MKRTPESWSQPYWDSQRLGWLLVVLGLILLILGSLPGCTKVQSLPPAAMDQLWYLHEDGYAQSQPRGVSVEGSTLPNRVVFRRSASVLRSTASIAQTVQDVQGRRELEVVVSDALAQEVADLLARARTSLDELRALGGNEPDAERWSEVVAAALVVLDEGVRMLAGESVSQGSGQTIARVIMEMINERTGGLLGELGPQETRTTRRLLAQVVGSLAFALVNRHMPAELPAQLAEAMASAPSPDSAQQPLQKLLIGALQQAQPQPESAQLPRLVDRTLRWMPRILQMVERLARQWPAVDYAAIELRERRAQAVLVLELQTQPGKHVVVDGVFPLQPALVFRGGVRTVVLPGDDGGGSVVQFSPIGEGAAELRLSAATYILARLAGTPLEGGTLRELRIDGGGEGLQRSRRVTLLLEAAPGPAGRRIISFTTTSHDVLQRSAFDVQLEPASREHLFNYVTPGKRYWFVYRR